MNTYENLKKRKYVIEYHDDAYIPSILIQDLLKKTWEVTPSKNNFMAYNVHVIGNNQKDLKKKVFLNCLSNEMKIDENLNVLNERYEKNPPAYYNIINCSYLFIFTMRLEDQPNQFQQYLINRGHNYEAVNEETLMDLYPAVSFEAGLFSNTLSSLLLEHDIASSFTGCFRRDLASWKEIPFVTRKPIMIMTAGKAKKYLEHNFKLPNPRPDFSRIVNFVN